VGDHEISVSGHEISEVVVKLVWVVTKSRNPEHGASRTDRLCFIHMFLPSAVFLCLYVTAVCSMLSLRRKFEARDVIPMSNCLCVLSFLTSETTDRFQ
jgi:hypothetical protein